MALFDDTTPISEITVDALVGEGKKFKTPDDLARAKAESDRVIAARERELAELREELAKRQTADELFEKLQRAQTPPPQSAREGAQEQPPVTPPSLTDEDLEKRIAETLDKRTKQQREADHAAEVSNRLIAVYGDEDKANEVVNAKARELGVSVKFLQDIALQSPKAFYAQLGLNETPKGTTPAPRSDVKTDSFSLQTSAKPGTFAYWQEQRKSMSTTEYFSPRVQNQIMKEAFDAAERGEDYFAT